MSRLAAEVAQREAEYFAAGGRSSQTNTAIAGDVQLVVAVCDRCGWSAAGHWQGAVCP